MKIRALPFLLALLTALALPGATAPVRAQASSEKPNPTLPKIEMQAGIHRIQAEVASDFQTRARGLMFRERLGPNEGMVFVFQEKSQQCFWMRNTLIPLSAAFIDDDGRIVNIADMAPKTENSHCSNGPVRYVLEMEQGWFARRGLKAGAMLGGPPGMFLTRRD